MDTESLNIDRQGVVTITGLNRWHAKKQEMARTEKNKWRVPLIRIEKRVVLHRKATNHEIIRDAFAREGEVRLNIALRIKGPGGKYVGFNDTGFTVITTSEEAAKAFPDKLKAAAVQIAQELGGRVPRRDAAGARNLKRGQRLV